jgi:hypothetical protein
MLINNGGFDGIVGGDRIFFRAPSRPGRFDVPDRQNTTGLSETSLLRDTTDALLKDGGDLGRGSLGLGSVRANAVKRTGSSRADL